MVPKAPLCRHSSWARRAASPECSFGKSRGASPIPPADSAPAWLICKGTAGAVPCHLPREPGGIRARLAGKDRARVRPGFKGQWGGLGWHCPAWGTWGEWGEEKEKTKKENFFSLRGWGVGMPAEQEAPGHPSLPFPPGLRLCFPKKPGNSCFPSLTAGKMTPSSFPRLFGQCGLTLPTPRQAGGTGGLVPPSWGTHLGQLPPHPPQTLCAGAQ